MRTHSCHSALAFFASPHFDRPRALSLRGEKQKRLETAIEIGAYDDIRGFVVGAAVVVVDYGTNRIIVDTN